MIWIKIINHIFWLHIKLYIHYKYIIFIHVYISQLQKIIEHIFMLKMGETKIFFHSCDLFYKHEY